jgi:hypothetical protein
MKRSLCYLICGAILQVLPVMPCDCASAQDAPTCHRQTVLYTPFDDHFAARMTVEMGEVDMFMDKTEWSPLKTRVVGLTSMPDNSHSGSWNTGGMISGGVQELLTFRGHERDGVNVHWLNEELLYGSVRWSQLVSTDFVLDVEKMTFIYREMANYGEPCAPVNEQEPLKPKAPPKRHVDN